MNSFSVDELLDTLGETITLLRDPYAHGDHFRPFLTDAGDFEFVSLWRACLTVGVDPAGIPAWKAGGIVRGLSSRTSSTHVAWMTCDVADRLTPDSSVEVHRLLWTARLRSMSASGEVSSLMAQVRDRRTEDEFEAWRAEDGGSASVA